MKADDVRGFSNKTAATAKLPKLPVAAARAAVPVLVPRGERHGAVCPSLSLGDQRPFVCCSRSKINTDDLRSVGKKIVPRRGGALSFFSSLSLVCVVNAVVNRSRTDKIVGGFMGISVLRLSRYLFAFAGWSRCFRCNVVKQRAVLAPDAKA